MWKRFLTIGICIIFILSLGLTFTMTQGQLQAVPSCSVYAAEAVDSADSTVSTAKVRNICIGIWLYLPNPWGGWGWWCLGKLV